MQNVQKKRVTKKTVFHVTWEWASGESGTARIPKGVLGDMIQVLLHDNRLGCVRVDGRRWSDHVDLYGGLVIKGAEIQS